MDPWHWGAILAFFVVAVAKPERIHRLRVWLAMLGGSLAMYIYPNVWYYLALDIIVATVIMLPPKTTWQRAIGACHVLMALVTTGYILRDITALQFSLSSANSPEMLKNAHDFLAWAAIGFLILWGCDGLLGTDRNRTGDSGGLRPAKQGRVR